jgi:hypothetical protein
MPFRIEDLVLTVTVRNKGDARIAIEGCENGTVAMILADCGKTQNRQNLILQDHPANVAFKLGGRKFTILRDELKDALRALDEAERRAGRDAAEVGPAPEPEPKSDAPAPEKRPVRQAKPGKAETERKP